MTHLEAIERVEKALTGMNLKTVWGDSCVGLEAIGAVAQFHGPVLTEVENQFQSGQMSPLDYAVAMEILIDEVTRSRFRNKLERQLLEIRQLQGGVA